MPSDIKKVIADLKNDLDKKLEQAEQELSEPASIDTAAITDPSAMLFAERLRYAVMAAAAHSEGVMPWRPGYKTEEDCEWCTQVAHAVRDRRARPTHPDSEIEQALLDAFGT